MINIMPDAITILLLGAISVVSLLLYLLEYRNHRKLLEHLASKGARAIEQKSFNLLHDAMKKSEDMLSQAEMNSLQLASKTFRTTHELEEEYQKEIGEFQESLKHLLEQTTQNTLQNFSNYLDTLKRQSTDLSESTSQAVTQQAKLSLTQFQKQLSDMLLETQNKSLASLEQDKITLAQSLEKYKQERLASIDDNILAVVERTVSTVLIKRMSLKDHMDLIYDSLEQAKAEHFFTTEDDPGKTVQPERPKQPTQDKKERKV